MLSAWKGVPYVKRLCQGYDLGKREDEEHLIYDLGKVEDEEHLIYDLGKVEDEEHLLLVCPNT
jgi:hypothetical protein